MRWRGAARLKVLRCGRAILFALALALAAMGMRARLRPVVAAEQDVAAGEVVQGRLDQPDRVCARCHAAIYTSYERTAMARGSGEALEGLVPGTFTHEASGVTYRIFARDGRAWMSYGRPASLAGGEEGAGPLQGERELLYFVGSGTRGRTFLYRMDDQWFELPVNFYGRRKAWAMAPAYDNVQRMPAPLPVDANCLHCHASEVETALPEAKNRFPQRPFDQGGLGCSACHGDPAAHLKAEGHGPIVNPGKLPVAARDSACIQCHLEGDAVVYKPGRTLAQFVPGATLADFAVYFVRADQAAGGRRASSQYEAMLQSACKRASGDRMTCTTCHDPHSEPAPAERVAFYRARCLQCHTSPTLAATHHPEQPDCAICHMPTRATADISHEQLTDHNIQARPPKHAVAAGGAAHDVLVPVGDAAASDRELGLAYAQLAEKGDRDAAARALPLLRGAEAAGAQDEQVHVHLGVLQQMAGDVPAARVEYAAALREDPFNASALTNRAILDATAGELPEAVRLLDRLVRADPTQTQSGLDLAFLECRMGESAQSRALVERALAVDPDAPELRLFLAHGTVGGRSCRAASR